ncbi:MAG: hypothetical protein ABH837_01130 [bacterium]
MAHRRWMERERRATEQQYRPKTFLPRKKRTRIVKAEGSPAQISNRNWLFVRRAKKKQNRAARGL